MKKILVVEDEYYARKSIVKILQESDLDIQVCGEAENGMKAIELLEEYKDIALVIQCMFCHFPYSFNSLYPLYRMTGKKANGKISAIRHSAYACDRAEVRQRSCTKKRKKRICRSIGVVTTFSSKD